MREFLPFHLIYLTLPCINSTALGTAKTAQSFGLSDCGLKLSWTQKVCFTFANTYDSTGHTIFY